MQSLVGAARSARTRCFSSSNVHDLSSVRVSLGFGGSGNGSSCSLLRVFVSSLHSLVSMPSSLNCKVGEEIRHCASSPLTRFSQRTMSTVAENASDPALPIAPRIKFKRLDKTARNIMQILDREAVSEVKSQREVPDIKPGYIIQMKVESPENKRRITTIKGIVIARRNAGLNTTFRLRRLVAGVGVESLFPLYSPNIKEVKVIDKKKVRRAKLYYLREKMNPLKK